MCQFVFFGVKNDIKTGNYLHVMNADKQVEAGREGGVSYRSHPGLLTVGSLSNIFNGHKTT